MTVRYAPDLRWPLYTYVPGRTPRPADGEVDFGDATTSLNPDSYMQCRGYLAGVDLFNAGYYWEAHEVWESYWHAAGRTGVTADYLKGLIKWAAAGVKQYEGRTEGVRRHVARSRELLAGVRASQPMASRFAGATLSELCTQLTERISAVCSAAPVVVSPPIAGLMGTITLVDAVAD